MHETSIDKNLAMLNLIQIFELKKLMHGTSIGNNLATHNLVLANVQHVVKHLNHV